MFHDRSLPGRSFRYFVLPVLEYCSAVRGSAADIHLSGARFLTGGVFEFDIAHHWTVAVMFMLYKIRFNPIHPLISSLPGSYVTVRVTRGCSPHIVILMPRLAAEPQSTAWLLFLYQCPSGIVLLILYSMVWDWRVSREGPMIFYSPKLLYPYYRIPLFSLSLSVYIGWYFGAGVFGLIGCIWLSLNLALSTSYNNYNNDNKNEITLAKILTFYDQITINQCKITILFCVIIQMLQMQP